jgi:hypothetical protein
MPSRTLEDKVEDLTKLTARLEVWVDNLVEQTGILSRDVREQNTALAALQQQLTDLLRLRDQLREIEDLKRSMAVLQHIVEDLKKTKEEWGRRFWTLLGPLLGAVVGVLLGYYLRQ